MEFFKKTVISARYKGQTVKCSVTVFKKKESLNCDGSSKAHGSNRNVPLKNTLAGQALAAQSGGGVFKYSSFVRMSMRLAFRRYEKRFLPSRQEPFRRALEDSNPRPFGP